MLRATLITLLLAGASPAFAETPALADRNELSLLGHFDYQGPNGDNILLQLGYAWFLRDDLLVGGEYQWSLIEDIAPGDYRSQQLAIVVEKLFVGDDSLLPYVGAEAGFRNSKFSDLDESGLVYGLRAGLRYFLSDSVSLDASLRLLLSDKKVFIVDFEAEDQYVYPSFGIKAVF